MRKLDRTIKKLAIAIEIICIIYHFSLHKNHSQSYNSGTETDPKAEPQSRRAAEPEDRSENCKVSGDRQQSIPAGCLAAGRRIYEYHSCS